MSPVCQAPWQVDAGNTSKMALIELQSSGRDRQNQQTNEYINSKCKGLVGYGREMFGWVIKEASLKKQNGI